MAKIKSFKPSFRTTQKDSESQSLSNSGNQINRNSGSQSSSESFRKSDSLRIIPLGGVGDVTKNMYVYEYQNDIIIVDCGVSFPDEDMMGVDLVIPDISYLRDKKSRIRGIIISHAHDDHIGALPYIWPELNVPIYSQKLTCGFIRSKFIEHNLPKDQIKTLKIDDKLNLGAFNVSFYQVSHSVPDSTGIVIKTPIGTVIHQSDFKIDWTPVNGQVTDVNTVARLGSEGVLMMLIDSLRSEREGYTPSERTIEPTFEQIEKETKGKLLLSLVTSNITRIQQAVNMAVRIGRKVVFSGRSMENNVQTARDLGYLDIAPNLVVAQEEVKRFADNKLLIVIAGSLGQRESALARVAYNDHKFIRLNKNDTVIFSSDPMPSAEASQDALIDALSRIGCSVYYSGGTPDLHVSGHAAAEELKLMINLAKPKFLMPIGGNFKHLRAFSKMAQQMGYQENEIVISTEVCAIEVLKDRFRFGNQIKTANIYVDGLGVGDVGSIVLRDRQLMSEEGVVFVVVPVDRQNGKLTGEPDIISRGFIFGEGGEDILEAAKEIVKSLLTEHPQGYIDHRYIRHNIEGHLEKFFYQELKRNPLIITLVVEL